MKRKIPEWFNLTYSNYLVLPRAALQSMPDGWQEKFVALLDELRETADRSGLEFPDRYRVHAVNTRGRYVRDPIPHYKHAPNIFSKK
jgi:hypothetical protein